MAAAGPPGAPAAGPYGVAVPGAAAPPSYAYATSLPASAVVPPTQPRGACSLGAGRRQLGLAAGGLCCACHMRWGALCLGGPAAALRCSAARPLPPALWHSNALWASHALWCVWCAVRAGYAAVTNTKDNPPCNTLFIGNLGDGVNETELRGVFRWVGGRAGVGVGVGVGWGPRGQASTWAAERAQSGATTGRVLAGHPGCVANRRCALAASAATSPASGS